MGAQPTCTSWGTILASLTTRCTRRTTRPTTVVSLRSFDLPLQLLVTNQSRVRSKRLTGSSDRTASPALATTLVGSWTTRVAPLTRRTPKSARQGVLPQSDAVSSHSKRLALVAIFPAVLLNLSGPKEWLVGLSPVRKLLSLRNQTCALMRSWTPKERNTEALPTPLSPEELARPGLQNRLTRLGAQ